MATDIVGSLFGVTPELYQEQRDQLARQRAVQLAQMAPLEQASYGAARAGQQFGGALASAMGVEDPTMRLYSQRNALAKQFDINTPQGLLQYSNALQEAGDVQGAAAAADRYRAIQGALIEQTQKAAIAQKTMAEAGEIATKGQTRQSTINQLKNQYGLSEDEAVSVASNPDLVKSYLTPKSSQGFELLKAGKFTPESVANWTTGAGQLEPIDLTSKPSDDWLKIAREQGLPAKKTFNDYTPEQVAKVNELEFQRKLREKAAGAAVTRVSVDVRQEEEFAKNRGKSQAEELTNAASLARGASQALGTLGGMKQLADSGQLFTGPLAPSYVGASNFLASLNLLSADQTKRLTSSEIYDKQAKDLVMQDLGGKLGAQISDADRKFVEARIPQLTTSAKARTELIDKLQEIQRGKIDYWRKMNDYANKKGNLNEFDFSEVYSPITKSTPAAGGVGGAGWSIKAVP